MINELVESKSNRSTSNDVKSRGQSINHHVTLRAIPFLTNLCVTCYILGMKAIKSMMGKSDMLDRRRWQVPQIFTNTAIASPICIYHRGAFQKNEDLLWGH